MEPVCFAGCAFIWHADRGGDSHGGGGHARRAPVACTRDSRAALPHVVWVVVVWVVVVVVWVVVVWVMHVPNEGEFTPGGAGCQWSRCVSPDVPSFGTQTGAGAGAGTTRGGHR